MNALVQNEFLVKISLNKFHLFFSLFKDYGKSETKKNTNQTSFKSF